MKKTFLSLGILSALAFSVNAQDAAAPTSSEFKPSAGNITVEVLATSPFAGSGAPFDLQRDALDIPSLRFRYFLSESMAVRLNFAIDANKYKQDFGSKTDVSGSQTGNNVNNTGSLSNTAESFTVTSNRFMVAIAPGLEFHKGISERLNVYYGAYIDFAMQSAKGKIVGKPASTSSNTNINGTGTFSNQSAASGEYTYEVKGQNFGDLDGLESPTGSLTAPSWGATTTSITSPSFGGSTAEQLRADNGSRAFTRIGLVGVIGADYYITKGLYLGLEVGWGYTNYMYRKVTVEEKATAVNVTTTTQAGTTPTTAAPVTSATRKIEENKDSQWNITPTVNAAFRFGFWF